MTYSMREFREFLLLPMLAVSLACGPSGPHEDPFAVQRQDLVTPLALPGRPGNGLAVKNVCPGQASNGNCNFASMDTIAKAVAALNSTAATVTPPAAPAVFSWVQPGPVDFTDYNGATRGLFNVDFDTRQLYPFGTAHLFPWSFAGWIAIPPSNAAVTKTFAVGSDDGVLLAVSNGTQLFSCSAGVRSFAYGCTPSSPTNPQPPNTTNLQVTFPANAAGALYPIELVFFEQTGQSGVELTWADGAKAANPASGAVNGFTLIPQASLYAPDVKAALYVDNLTSAAAAVTQGTQLRYTAGIVNQGPVAASGLKFTVVVATAQLTGLASATTGCTAATAGGNATLTCTGISVAAGATANIVFTATVANAVADGTSIDVQGVVQGLATSNDFSTGGTPLVGDTAQIFVYTDDAAAVPPISTQESGNGPASLVGIGAGLSDDDATRVTLTYPVTQPPAVTGPAGTLTSATTQVVSGTSPYQAGLSIKVTLTSGATTTSCTATVVQGGGWTCPALALDAGAWSAVATLVNPAGLPGTPSPAFAFTVSAPPAPTVTQPAANGVLRSQPTVIAGTSTSPAGTPIKVSVVDPTNTTRTCNATVQTDGSWICSLALADGGYSVSAAALSVTGTPGASSASSNFTVNTVGLPAPTLAQTASPTTNNRPALGGTAQASALGAGFKLVVYDGPTAICTVSPLSATPWSCTPGSALGEGQHVLTAVIFDAAGNASPASNADAFVVDTVKPAAPTLAAVPSPSNVTKPVYSGTGEPFATVTVKDNSGATLCTAVVAASGAWTCTSATALAQGVYVNVSAVQTDAAGNLGPASAAIGYTIDTSAPAITMAAVPAQPINTATPTLSGTTEAGATVIVRDQTGRVVCQISSAPASWTCTSAALAGGANTLTATATDAAGNSASAGPQTVVVDTVAPAPPVIAQTASPTSNTKPAFSGSAEPGAKVTVSEGATTLCSTTADAATGAWSCTSTVALTGAPQTHAVTAKASDAAGNTSAASNTDTFVVDTTKPAPPSLDPVAPSPGAQTGYLATGQPTFSGTGVVGDLVTVRTSPGGAVLCTGVVNASGTWACTTSNGASLTAGSYTVVADQLTPAGVTSNSSGPQAFTVVTAAPGKPTIDPLPAVGQSASVALSGTAAAGASVTVRDETGRVLCTVTADAAGKWACAATLHDGASTLTAVATGPSGLSSPPSDPRTTTVDAVAPVAPQLAQTPSPTSNTSPTFAGSAEPGSTVNLYADGGATPVASCVAAANGVFSCPATMALAGAPQSHTVRATATDAAGNVSPMSNADTYTVDTRPSSAPTLAALPTPAGGQPGTVGTTRPVFSGTGTAGSTVTVAATAPSAQTLCAAVVRADGTWSCESTVALTGQPATAYTAQATQTSLTGATSAPSAPISFTVDTRNPSAPTLTGPATPSSSATVALSGSGTPGARLEVRDATGRLVCSVDPVPAGGSWTCAAGPLPDGQSTLTATTIGAGGVVSAPSAALQISVDTLAPAAPALAQSPSPSSNTLPVFTGTAEPGSAVKIFDGATQVASCTADSRGLFSCAATTPVTGGPQGGPQTHVVTATATDAAGNTSAPSNLDTFVVDTRLPPAPTLSPQPTPAGGQAGFTSDTQPVFSGTGQPGATVNVQSGQPGPGTLCAALVKADGTWSCTSAVVLTGQPATTYSVTAVQKSPAGVASGKSDSESVTVLTQPPATPRLTVPPSPSSSATPALTGTADAGTQVVVKDGTGQVVCTATVGADGKWSCSTSKLPDGTTGLTATSVGPSGVSSPPSGPKTVLVDTVAPAAPLLAQTPSPTGLVRPTFTGTAEPGSAVTLREGSTVLCSATADASGIFRCTSAVDLPGAPASHTVTATAADAAGNASGPSASDTFVVDTSVPVAPTIDVAPAPPNGQPGTSPSATPLITGTGTPGNTVTVTAGGTTLCTAVVRPDGTWACTSAVPLSGDPAASYGITAVQTTPAGVTGAPTTTPLLVDTATPAAPTFDPPVTPGSEPRPVFTGTGQTGDTVSLLDAYGHLLCSALVDTAGRWSCQPAAPLADGDYTLRAVQTSPAGRPSGASASAPLSLHTLFAPTFSQPRSPTREPKPALAGTGTPGRTVQVYSGPTPLCTALVAADGTWSCTPDTALSSGSYLLSAVQVDAAGHTSPAVGPRLLVIDTVAPNAPVLDAPASPTEDQKPQLTGTAEPGSTVKLVDGLGNLLCTTTATPAGTFACRPTQPLPLGPTTITATATDAASNTSPASAPQTVVVRAPKGPPEVAITGPSDAAQLSEPRPVLTGTSTPGAKVEVALDGITYEALVAADGAWTLLVPTDLATGSHALDAVAIDERGVRSTVAHVSFTILQHLVARGGCQSGGVPAPGGLVLGMLWLLRRRKTAPGVARRALAGSGTLALFAALLVPAAARAQATTDLELFHPASGSDGFAGVEGARPLVSAQSQGQRKFEIKLWAGAALQPLVTHDAAGGKQVLVSNRVGSWLSGQVHVWDNLSIAAQLPLVLSQRGDLSPLPQSTQAGLSLGGGIGDLRVTPRWALLRQTETLLDLALQVSLDLPTGSAGSMAGTGRVGGEGLLALGRRFYKQSPGFFELLGNGYLRLRPPAQILDVKIGNELGLRGALAYFPEQEAKVVPARLFLELEGHSWMRGGFADGTAPAEWRAGSSWCLGRGFAIDFAAGTALGSGVGSPKARFLLAIGMAPEQCRPSDRDGDGLADRLDKCPDQPGPASNGGCPAPPDADGDGVPDSEDACPALAGLKENRGCPASYDRDGDGVPDLQDKCPEVPGPASNYGCPITEAVACVPAAVKKVEDLPLPEEVAAPPLVISLAAPLPDRDGDGVPDAQDNCPDQPGPADNQGCPKEQKQLVVIKGDKIDILDKVYFASAKAVIEKRSFRLLDQVAAVLKNHPELLRVEVQGHTDNAGDAKKNQKLSQSRAEAVVVYLMKAGLDISRLVAKGYGQTQPEVPNSTKANKERNRRVEFHVLEVQSPGAAPAPPGKS